MLSCNVRSFGTRLIQTLRLSDETLGTLYYHKTTPGLSFAFKPGVSLIYYAAGRP